MSFPTSSMYLPVFNRIWTVDSLAGLVAVAVAVTFLYNKRQAILASKSGVPLPPGPPARWFWDNALPSVNIAHTLGDLIAEYGPVIALRQGSHVIVIIGRVHAATEIMEKQGVALADRPHSIAAGEILSKGLRLLLVGTGERLRRFRKAVHTHLQPKAARGYQELQLENAKEVIVDILNDPSNHKAHVQRYSASIVLRVTYGKSSPTSNDDPEVVRIHQQLQNFQHAMRPGAFLVDRIPLLKYIPGYGRQLKDYHDFEMRLYKDQMNRVRSEMAANIGGHSFMRTLFEHVSEHKLSEDEMAYLAGNMFGAGSETTAVALNNMILAAACFPETQKRVQEELDNVVGSDRLPTWDDSASLPQVHAFIKETLRWRPITPIGFAHRATQDVIWGGQCIPAGATVIGCHWAISRDPVAFPEPEIFDPQRWIDAEGRLRNDMCAFTFGFGRRVCPGEYLAYNSLYINMALLLWSFRIVERPDKPIDVNAFSDAITSHAAPFDVEFIPRVEKGLLREMMTE